MAEPEGRGAERRIWLIDRRDYWRQWGGCALEAAGFAVRSWDRYTYPPEDAPPGEAPGLVVLACTLAGDEERRLVEQVAVFRHRILVLASSVPTHVMRSLFRVGASDVADMPASPEGLAALAEQALACGPAPSPFEAFLSARARR